MMPPKLSTSKQVSSPSQYLDGCDDEEAYYLASAIENDVPSDYELDVPKTPSPSPSKTLISKKDTTKYNVRGGPSPGLYEEWYEAAKAAIRQPGANAKSFKDYSSTPTPRQGMLKHSTDSQNTPLQQQRAESPFDSNPSSRPGPFFVVFKGTCPGIYYQLGDLFDAIEGVDGAFYMEFDNQEEAMSSWRSAIQSGGLAVLEPSVRYRNAKGSRSAKVNSIKEEPSPSFSISPDSSPLSTHTSLKGKSRQVKFEPEETPTPQTPSKPPKSSSRRSVEVKTPSQPRDLRSPSQLSSNRNPNHKGYAVFVGRNPGVYDSWLAAGAEVNGVSGGVQESYETRAIAEQRFAEALKKGCVSKAT